jgi:serine/threonine protein phosphatase 1
MTTSNWSSTPGGHKSDRPIFAIGDVHGCYEQFLDALNACDRLASEYTDPDKRPVIVPIGDYIDRGPDNWACLRLAMQWKAKHADFAPLPGNHEQMLWAVLSSKGNHMERWIAFQVWDQKKNGFAKLLEEVGVGTFSLTTPNFNSLNARLPGVLEWMEKLPTYHLFGDVLLVHAGLPSNIRSRDDIKNMEWKSLPVDREFIEDHPLWVRFEEPPRFYDLGLTMVNGHTIVPDTGVYGKRVWIDSGCYETGVLTILEVNGDQMRQHKIQPRFNPSEKIYPKSQQELDLIK